MGQSAGAVHVASYLAHSRFHGKNGANIAGALLLSCIYDIAAADVNTFHQAYFGEDETAYPACSSAQGLIESSVPWMASLAEFDVPDFQKQAAHFALCHVEQTGRYPPIHYLSGHNHLSPALEIGSPGATLEPVILDFIASQTV